MGLLGKLIDISIDVVQLPTDIVMDKFTLGGVLIDRDQPYTIERANKLLEQVQSLTEDGDHQPPAGNSKSKI